MMRKTLRNELRMQQIEHRMQRSKLATQSRRHARRPVTPTRTCVTPGVMYKRRNGTPHALTI